MLETLARASLVLALLLPACGSTDHPEGVPTGAPSVPPATGCVDGQIRECRIMLAIREGYSDCISGKQRCVSGGWTECLTDKVFTETVSDAGLDARGDAAAAISDASSD